MNDNNTVSTDVLIIGGGPSGLPQQFIWLIY